MLVSFMFKYFATFLGVRSTFALRMLQLEQLEKLMVVRDFVIIIKLIKLNLYRCVPN